MASETPAARNAFFIVDSVWDTNLVKHLKRRINFDNMRTRRRLIILTAMLAMLYGCQSGRQTGEPSVEPEQQKEAVTAPQEQKEDRKSATEESSPAAQAVKGFALGADISWETLMEKNGQKLYNFEGAESWECTALMKDLGLNAVRLRVWVDPESLFNAEQQRRAELTGQASDAVYSHKGSCDKQDLLEKALRAKKLGMDIMVDFHYSDDWADGDKQPVPQSWKGHSYEEMKEDLRKHTIDVLSFLKENGVKPKWVQVGNETSHGMLWSYKSGRDAKQSNGEKAFEDDMGRIETHPEQYAGFIQAGCKAVKSVFPHAITIVHLDNGWKPDLYDRNLGILEKNGVDYDMVGMSVYPYWAKANGLNNADLVIDECIANIKHVHDRFGKESIIVETGFECNESQPKTLTEGYRLLSKLIRESVSNTDGHCHGVFYWEPECRPSQYKLGAFTKEGRPTVIMNAFKEYSN